MIDGHASVSSAWDRALGALKGQGCYHAPAPKPTQLDKPPGKDVKTDFSMKCEFQAGKRKSEQQLEENSGNSFLTNSLNILSGTGNTPKPQPPGNFKLIESDDF